MKSRPIAAIVACCVFFAGALRTVAKDEVSSATLKKALGSVPVAELPAKAVQLVSQAKLSDRQATTVETVKTAVNLRPAAAPAIVGAIARAVPEMAALAAGVAASEQPKQTEAIARAATGAAPSRVTEIVASLCRAVPNQYRNVAVAAAQILPGAGREILAGVSTGLPGLRPSIENALAKQTGTAPSLTEVLDQAANSSDGKLTTAATTPVAAPSFSRGPTISGPYIPLSNTPTNVTTGTSGDVPPGGRDYARPL